MRFTSTYFPLFLLLTLGYSTCYGYKLPYERDYGKESDSVKIDSTAMYTIAGCSYVGGKPLGFSILLSLGMANYKGFGAHVFAEPGIKERGISFGLGANRSDVTSKAFDPYKPGVFVRLTGLYFFPKAEKYSDELYIGPEIGFDMGVGFRFGVLMNPDTKDVMVTIAGTFEVGNTIRYFSK